MGTAKKESGSGDARAASLLRIRLVAARAGVTTRTTRIHVRTTASAAKVTTASAVHVDAAVHAGATPIMAAVKTSTAGRHACMRSSHHAARTHAASAHHHAAPTVTEGSRAGGR